MKLTVRKSSCPVCKGSDGATWTVTDSGSGHISYISRSWRKAFDYAYAASNPAPGTRCNTVRKLGR